MLTFTVYLNLIVWYDGGKFIQWYPTWTQALDTIAVLHPTWNIKVNYSNSIYLPRY